MPKQEAIEKEPRRRGRSQTDVWGRSTSTLGTGIGGPELVVAEGSQRTPGFRRVALKRQPSFLQTK